MKRLLTDSEMRNMIAYYAKCQSLRDFIDEKVVPTKLYYHKIKQYTNMLIKELEGQVDELMVAGKDSDTQDSVLDQFVNASVMSDHLFDIALKLESLDRDKKIECADKISQILKEYGVE
jgi:hypothetical protein